MLYDSKIRILPCSAYPPLVLAPSLPDLTSHGLCDVESHLQSEEPVTVVYLCPGKASKPGASIFQLAKTPPNSLCDAIMSCFQQYILSLISTTSQGCVT